MKIGNIFILTSLIVFFISSTSLSQTDTTESGSWNYKYEPKFAGGQVELCAAPPFIREVPFLREVGGLLDVDLFRNQDLENHYIGLRLAGEFYGYGNLSKTFGDICVYGRTSLRYSKFRIDVYGGLAYHIREDSNGNDKNEILPRIGLEMKYIPIGNYVGILLKGSFSFKSDTGFLGLGIALGYFN